MPALNEHLIFYFENKFYKIHKIKSASILSYLNIHQKKKKKKWIKIVYTTSSSKQLSYETFLHKTNNLRPLWNRLVVETSRPNRRRKAYAHAQWGARCPFELVCVLVVPWLSAQLTRRISHCEGDRASRVVATPKIRPADNYSADGTTDGIYRYIDSIPIVETRFLLFVFALCVRLKPRHTVRGYRGDARF